MSVSVVKPAHKTLLYSLILSDFLILLKKDVSATAYVDYVVKRGAVSYAFLNLFEQIQAIKLLVRMLRAFRLLQKNKCLFLFTENIFQSIFFFQLVRKRKFLMRRFVSCTLPQRKKRAGFLSHLFLNFNSLVFSKKLLRSFFKNQYLFCQHVNSAVCTRTMPGYFLYNNLDDNKKMIFLFVLLAKTLQKKKVGKKVYAKIKKIQRAKA